MLEALIVILVVLWALGFFAMHITAGFLHLLLVVAAIVLIVRLFSGRRTTV